METKPIRKILIANRGEIACRIIRTCRQMSITSVAVYSDADRVNPHVQMADQAVYIGSSPASESYLKGDVIIQAATDTQCDAIHPGYGFLSENADFAKSVVDAGLIFIGPSPQAMSIMGDKLDAKRAISDFDIPFVPGTDEALANVGEAVKIIEHIGLPVLIKASAGGGGKGMRKVESIADVERSIQQAMSEAESSFGNPAVFIEKYIENPRHIEIQIIADNHGNTCHLFERECSIQRRHQKVIEESPSPIMTSALRQKMGETAIRVAQSCEYSGVGTVEFLVDENRDFYFLEMNTRLQVEHPVTEMTTGLDLVELQINIAHGEALPFQQEDLSQNGHSIELRVYAEDPKDNFTPSIGTLTKYQLPHGNYIRVDDGIQQGMEIPIYYDPMIAKLVVWGSDRIEAISRMLGAIEDYKIEGIETTLSFGEWVMNHPKFMEGDIHTHFIEDYYYPELNNNKPTNEIINVAKMGAKLYQMSIDK